MTPTPEEVAALLARFWDLRDADVQPWGGGMNSDTWLVAHRGGTYVAKHVPTGAVDDLLAGAEVATSLARAGFVSGHPVPTSDGRLVLVEHGLALLVHVAGAARRVPTLPLGSAGRLLRVAAGDPRPHRWGRAQQQREGPP